MDFIQDCVNVSDSAHVVTSIFFKYIYSHNLCCYANNFLHISIYKCCPLLHKAHSALSYLLKSTSTLIALVICYTLTNCPS
jgi:hypothetical protein